jgi:hypothetical protein
MSLEISPASPSYLNGEFNTAWKKLGGKKYKKHKRL